MRALGSWPVLLGSLAWAGLPVAAGAQPVGSEFQVNTYTTSRQYPRGERAVAADASGNFVVVWTSCCSGQDGDSAGIFGQRYDSEGIALGDEFQINSYTTSSQASASVASDASGNFVVVWDGLGQGGLGGIYGQRYDSAGVARGDEFRVNFFTPAESPSVASDASGNFFVVWHCDDGYSSCGVFGQRYDSGGGAKGSEFQIPSGSSGRRNASIASDASGNFVVVWEFGGYFGPDHIDGRRYDSEGMAQGDEFRIRIGSSGDPSVASDANGNFVVVWDGSGQGDNSGIFGQRYDSAGVAQGDEFRVNSYTTESQRLPSVGSDASGNFVVVWDSRDQDGDSFGVFGQRYDDGGVAQGDEFQINSYTTDRQSLPSVGATGTNEFVVVWESYSQDGSGIGVFGKRFDFGGLPSLSISDVSVNEGNLPGRVSRNWALFAVTLSAPSTQTVTLDYATANGSAMAPSDYAAKSGTLTLTPGQTSAVIAVRVKEDDVQESDETFFVNLSNPANATIDDGQGVGTILNDDP